ncbi:MAG: hypothetical protein PVG79_10755 [Gemmatimonadales bacterium]
MKVRIDSVDLRIEPPGPDDERVELSELDVWGRQGPDVWRAERFFGPRPYFYPIYRHGDLYSYSPLSLILLKGRLDLDRGFARQVSSPWFRYYSGTATVDREIERIGEPLDPTFRIKDTDHYIDALADALRRDVADAEARLPGTTNIVLCGGRDSLALLLLPWKNPVLVASGAPNFELVERFIAEQSLGCDLVELRDDGSLLNLEILVNCCRNRLEHCRYGPHLRSLAESFDRKVVFWQGSLADTFTTPYWRRYRHKSRGLKRLLERTADKIECRREWNRERATVRQWRYFDALWRRGAMWQGAHHSIIRQLTGALTLSAYHGPAMREVLRSVDLFTAVPHDIRPQLGARLFGAPVAYPETNPGPPKSGFRKGHSHLKPFLKRLSALGIPISTS